MKKSVLDQIDAKLEQIVMKLSAAGRRDSKEPFTGVLPPEEYDSLALAQEALMLLRFGRKP